MHVIDWLMCCVAPSISNMADLEPGTVRIPSSTAKRESGESSSSSIGAKSAGGESVKGKRPKLPSFWIPTLTPSASPTEIKKPVSRDDNFSSTTVLSNGFRQNIHISLGECFFP